MHITLSCSNRTVELGDEGYDIGIRMSRTLDPKVVAHRLAVNRKIMCAAPAYPVRRGTPGTIEDMAQYEGVLFPPLAPKAVWAPAPPSTPGLKPTTWMPRTLQYCRGLPW